VENRENLYYQMPFYMTYPMQNLYLMEMEYEKDMERMKELYPREVQKLQQMIERRCDEMEYEGSRMYDENPDRRMLEEEVRRILEKFLRENPQYENVTPTPPISRPEDMRPPMQPMPRPEDMRPPMQPVPRPEDMRPPMQPVPRPEDMRPPMQNRARSEELMAQNRRDNDHTWLRSLIGILFHDEMYRRRCRHRRCNRWW